MSVEKTKGIKLHYLVPKDDFSRAREASTEFKKALVAIGVPAEIVRKAAIAMYEGKINMAIYAGGAIDITIYADKIEMCLTDKGQGIKDISKALQKGFQQQTQYETSELHSFATYQGTIKKPTINISRLSEVYFFARRHTACGRVEAKGS